MNVSLSLFIPDMNSLQLCSCYIFDHLDLNAAAFHYSFILSRNETHLDAQYYFCKKSVWK